MLDLEMLSRRGVRVGEPDDGANRPAPRPGMEIAQELAGRLLIRYLMPSQIGQFIDGSDRETFTTPTPYTAIEAIRWLNLPFANVPRAHGLTLDPRKVNWIIGPMYAVFGGGIQYILPEGFNRDAIVTSGAPTGGWEFVVH